MHLFSRAPNQELSGLRLEVFGLALLLAAAIWQAAFSDWFDRQNTEWQHYIQEDINFAILWNQKGLANMATWTPDHRSLGQARNDIAERASNAVNKAIHQRDKRAALREGQANFFRNVRLLMAAVGALLIVAGKYLIFVHKTKSALAK